MKHKKIFLLCGLALICCLIGLAGCKQEHVHNMQFVAAAEPTCTEEGRKAYWFCKDCNKYFADEGGATEISPASLAIEAAGHDISEEWRYNGEEHWHECKRCSEKFESAPHVFGETDYCTCGFEIPSTENLAYRLSEDKSYCIITGIGGAEMLKAVLSLVPLDGYSDPNMILMKLMDCDVGKIDPVIWKEYEKIAKAADENVKIGNIDRFEFYERAKNAFAVIATGEEAVYANIIIKKGVIKF